MRPRSLLSDRQDPLRPCWYGAIGGLAGTVLAIFVAPALSHLAAALLGMQQ